MLRPLFFACAFLVSLAAAPASARSIGAYSGCKPLGKYKQACLDCVGGGNFWQSGQNVCGLPGGKAKPTAADDDAGSDGDVASTGSGGGGGLGILSGLWLALLGLLGAASLIVARKPEAQEYFAKVTPYQGWIGAASMVWGLWGVIWALWHLGWLSAAPVSWLLHAAAAVLQLALGSVLGVGVIKPLVKHAKASAAMDQLVLKLLPFQAMLGIAAIAVGVLLAVTAMF